MFDELLLLMEKTRDLETAVLILKDIYEESKNALKRDTVSVEMADDMIRSVVSIQRSLYEAQVSGKYSEDRRMRRSLHYVKQCYEDLEGMLREIRADKMEKGLYTDGRSP